MSFFNSSQSLLIREPTEVQLLTAAVTAFCSYIQRLTDVNGGVFPESLARHHVSFVDAMRTELKDALIMIDKRYAADFDDYISRANITLDDVAIPKSFLDDGLELSFINSNNAEPNSNRFFKDERPPSVASSTYFSAFEEFEIDDTQSDFDMNDSQPDLSLGFSELSKNASIFPTGDFLTDEIILAAVENQEDLLNGNNLIGELEEDIFFKENENFDEPRPAEPIPPSSSMDFNKFDYRCKSLDITQENDSSCSLISSFSSIVAPKTPLRTSKTPEEKENEYIPSPSPSPIKMESSIDAITAALQTIKFGKSSININKDIDELLNVDAITKSYVENQKMTTKENSAEKEVGRSPLRSKNESDV